MGVSRMSSSTVAHLAATTDDIVSQICWIGLRATKTGVINCVSIWTAELVPGQIDSFHEEDSLLILSQSTN